MATRIRPPVRRFGPVVPGGGAAVGAALQGAGQALGAIADFKTNRELLDIREQAQVDALEARQVTKMERSEAMTQIISKQIARNDESARILADAGKNKNFDNVQQEMDTFETDYNTTLFEDRSEQFQDIFLTADQSRRLGNINKTGTAVEAGRLRIIADNFQASSRDIIRTVTANTLPSEIAEDYRDLRQFAASLGIRQEFIESVVEGDERAAMEQYIRSLTIIDGLAALSDPDVANLLGEDGRESMRRDLNATARSLEANSLLTSRVTELLTGVNVIKQFNAGVPESDIRIMIESREAVSPEARKDALDQLEIYALARQRGPQPISQDQLRSNHVFSKEAMGSLLNGLKAIEEEDSNDDEKQEALLNLSRNGMTILSEATRLTALGQFNEDKLAELTFQMAPLTEGLFIFEQEEKGLFEKFLIALPGGVPLGGDKNKRMPTAIVSEVRTSMFLGQGRYGGLSSAQKSVMGRILIAESISVEGSSQPLNGEEAMIIAEAIFEKSAIRFMSDEFGLVGDNAEQVRGILFRDGTPATEPRQIPLISSVADSIRQNLALGHTMSEIEEFMRGEPGFTQESFDRAAAIVQVIR